MRIPHDCVAVEYALGSVWLGGRFRGLLPIRLGQNETVLLLLLSSAHQSPFLTHIVCAYSPFQLPLLSTSRLSTRPLESCTPMTTLPTRTNLLLLVRLFVLSQPITTDTIIVITTIPPTPPNVVSTLIWPHPCYLPWNVLLPIHAPSNASSLRHTLITSILNFYG